MVELTEALWRTFGRRQFRPGQREAIAASVAGQDVLLCLPTGAGKSLCFQLAALLRRQAGCGPAWVLSPLTALMNDQVASLQARGVDAVAWHSGLPPAEAARARARLAAGDYALAYLSPERALGAEARAWLARRPLGLLAVDEAHCISQWGHDFRPEYRRLSVLRARGGPPLMAVTGSASADTLDDIAKCLRLRRPRRVALPPSRANLAFEVAAPAPLAARLARLPAAVAAWQRQGEGGAAIVYAATRKVTEAAHAALCAAGLPAAAYHAGLSAAARARIERDFLAGRQQLLVATCAFGMGVDRGDVRWVLHLQSPARIEALVQEAGRAGRDGAPARCTLWWGPQDFVVQRGLIAKAAGALAREAATRALAVQRAYVQHRRCRQQLLAGALSAPLPEPCGRCDVCLGSADLRQGAGDAADDATAAGPPAPALAEPERARADAAILALARAMPRPVGRSALALALRGSEAKAVRRLRLTGCHGHGTLRDVALPLVRARIDALVEAGALVGRGRKYPTVWPAGRAHRARARGRLAPATGREHALRLALQRFCRAQAKALGWRRPYMVLSRKLMAALVAAAPDSLAALSALPGMGARKLELFGAPLLALVREHSA